MARLLSLFLAVLMVLGVMVGALSTVSGAATTKINKGIIVRAQPDITFYDLDDELIGTFSHSAKSDLIGFNNTRVIYRDEKGETIETNYNRADVTLHLNDGSGKYSEINDVRRNSYYLKYNMGSSTGEAFANNITTSKGERDTINLDVSLRNVVFRESNDMKMSLTYKYLQKAKTSSTKKPPKTYVKTKTVTFNFVFDKAKLDLTVKKPHSDGPTWDELDKWLEMQNNQNNNSNGINYGTDNKNDPTTPPTNPDGSTPPTNPDGSTPPTNPDGGVTPPNPDGGIKPPFDKPDGDSQTPPSTQFETPYLLLKEYSTGNLKQIPAGMSFPLEFTCMNTSQQIDLENIILKITPAEGLQIVDSTNVFYIPIINKGDVFSKTVNVSVLPNTTVGAHTIDINFSYEYVVNGTRQPGTMSQQISVSTVQPDRFSADPVGELLETTVGEEIYLTSKYVNKSRGDIYNLSATLVGEFNGANQINHVGNVAAGVSGEVEFSFIPDTAGPLTGEINYTYEDAVGTVHSVSVPFSTNITEAPVYDMPMDQMTDVPMDEPPPEEPGLLQKLTNPKSWEMWAAVGGIVVVVVIIVVVVKKKKQKQAELEFGDNDETV